MRRPTNLTNTVGHHRCTYYPHTFLGEVESRIEVRAFSNDDDDDIAPWHATIDDRLTRYHFEPFHLRKGVTRGITREGETGGRRLLRDRRTI